MKKRLLSIAFQMIFELPQLFSLKLFDCNLGVCLYDCYFQSEEIFLDMFEDEYREMMVCLLNLYYVSNVILISTFICQKGRLGRT